MKQAAIAHPWSKGRWAIGLGLPLLCAGYGLMDQGPWCDEVFTLMMASRGLWAGIEHGLHFYTAPLYPALAWVATGAGHSLLGGRLVSVVAFALTALAASSLGSTLGGRRAGSLAFLLVSTHPLLIWHAQDARPYSLMVFLAVLALAIQTRLLARDQRSFSWPLFLCVLCGLLTHLYFGCVLVALGLQLIGRRKEPACRPIWQALIGATAAALPLLLGLFLLSQGKDAGFHKKADLLALPYALATFANGYAFGATIPELHGASPLAATLAHLPEVAARSLLWWVPLLWALLRSPRLLRGRSRAWMLSASAVVLLPFLSSLAMDGVSFNTRYILAALPLLLVLGAAGMSAGQAGKRRLWLAVPILLSQLWGLAALRFQERYGKEDYAGVTAFIASTVKKGEPVHEGPSPGMINHLLGRDRVELLSSTRGLPSRAREGGGREFLIFNRPWDMDPGGVMEKKLRLEPGITRLHFRGFEVYIRPGSSVKRNR